MSPADAEGVPEATVDAAPSVAQAGGMARAATLVGLGSVASRIVGLLRETVKSHLFGATAHVSALEVATLVPNQLYDLLIGGMVSSALVPTFSEYVAREDYDELWHLFSALLTLGGLSLVVLVVLLELGAGLIAGMLGAGYAPSTLAEITYLLRVALPAVLFLSFSGMFTGMLYALKRFSLPAFAPVTFNVVIVLCALAFEKQLGVASMAMGYVVAAVAQLALQAPGLHGARLRPTFDWRHPGLRHIVRLYLPIIGGLVITQISIVIAISLASYTGQSAVAWMDYATLLFQFPLGLVSSAISVAILPTLSRQAVQEVAGVAGAAEAFRATLAQGLRLVLLLSIPATVGLFVLGEPIIALLFEHGSFTPADTQMTVQVLRYFLLGLIFAAVDLPLVFAFYARQDTLTPALVGVVGVLIYLAAGLAPLAWRALHITDLALANAIQLSGHALILFWLMERRLQGGLGLGRALTTAGAQAAAAALVMAPVAYGVYQGVHALVSGVAGAGTLTRVAALAPAGVVAGVVYAGLLWALGNVEVRAARAALARRP